MIYEVSYSTAYTGLSTVLTGEGKSAPQLLADSQHCGLCVLMCYSLEQKPSFLAQNLQSNVQELQCRV